MSLEAADEVVGELGEPLAALIVLVEEQVPVLIPEREMEVAPVPRQVAEGLRHEGRKHASLLGQRVHHVAEEDRAVAAGQRVGVGEFLLELPVRVLVVVCVVAPAELIHVSRDRGQELVVPSQTFEVVARLLECVERIGRLEPAVGPLAEQEVLELEPDHQLVTLGSRARELPAKDCPRVVRPLLPFHVDVAGEAGQVLLPGNRGEAVEVRDGGDVRIARQLAEVAGREAGEAGPIGEQRLEARGRNELRARAGVEVDELGEVELDPAFLGHPPDLLDAQPCRGRRHLALLLPATQLTIIHFMERPRPRPRARAPGRAASPSRGPALPAARALRSRAGP